MTASFTCPRCGRTSYHPIDVRERYCGNCHDFTGALPGTGPVRFTIRWDGHVMADDIAVVDFNDPEPTFDWLSRIAARHAAVCMAAEQRGHRYLVDIEWWDGEHTRWGTDVDGMVVPVEVGLARLAQAITRRWR